MFFGNYIECVTKSNDFVLGNADAVEVTQVKLNSSQAHSIYCQNLTNEL
jgi:hypothetical protein